MSPKTSAVLTALAVLAAAALSYLASRSKGISMAPGGAAPDLNTGPS